MADCSKNRLTSCRITNDWALLFYQRAGLDGSYGIFDGESFVYREGANDTNADDWRRFFKYLTRYTLNIRGMKFNTKVRLFVPVYKILRSFSVEPPGVFLCVLVKMFVLNLETAACSMLDWFQSQNPRREIYFESLPWTPPPLGTPNIDGCVQLVRKKLPWKPRRSLSWRLESALSFHWFCQSHLRPFPKVPACWCHLHICQPGILSLLASSLVLNCPSLVTEAIEGCSQKPTKCTKSESFEHRYTVHLIKSGAAVTGQHSCFAQAYLEDWEKLLDDPPFEDVPDLLDMVNMVDKATYTLAQDLADSYGALTLRVSTRTMCWEFGSEVGWGKERGRRGMTES